MHLADNFFIRHKHGRNNFSFCVIFTQNETSVFRRSPAAEMGTMNVICTTASLPDFRAKIVQSLHKMTSPYPALRPPRASLHDSQTTHPNSHPVFGRHAPEKYMHDYVSGSDRANWDAESLAQPDACAVKFNVMPRYPVFYSVHPVYINIRLKMAIWYSGIELSCPQ